MTKAPHDTLGALTESHLQLLEAWTGSKSQVRAAHALRRRIQKVGHQLADPAQRDAAQGLLDYWASRIAGCEGETYPEVLRLAAFDGGAVDRLADRAEAVLRGLPPADQLAAVRLFEAFHEGAERARAARLTSDELKALFPAGDWRAAADPFIEAGVLVRSRPAGSEVETLELASPALADQWGSLKEWLAYREQRIGYRRVRLGAARLWDLRGRKADGLLRGSVLTGALKTHLEDQTLDALGAARAGEEALKRHHDDQLLLDAYLRAGRLNERKILGGVGGVLTMMIVAFAILGLLLAQADQRARVAKKAFEDAVDLAAEETGAPSLEGESRVESAAPVGSRRVDGPIGCIWIGGSRSSRLGAARTGQPLPPETATVGQAYRILGKTHLRGECPTEDYQFGDVVGVVSDGRLMVAREAPRRYERPTDPGYWLEVRVTPRVYIQFRGGDALTRAALPGIVGQAGFDVPPDEERQDALNKLEVRYFKASDRAAAEGLARALEAAYVGLDGRTRTVETFLRSDIETDQIGVLEVWIDLDQVARRRSVPAPPRRPAL